jgi:hypothetical protein
VAGAFVGNREPPASGARGVSGGIAAIDDRTSAGDRDHARAGTEGRLQRDHHVADHFNRCRGQFGKDGEWAKARWMQVQYHDIKQGAGLETWKGMSYQTVLTPPELATGKVIYRSRVGAPGAYYASPVEAARYTATVPASMSPKATSASVRRYLVSHRAASKHTVVLRRGFILLLG